MARATDNYGYNISRRRPRGRVYKTAAVVAAAAGDGGIKRWDPALSIETQVCVFFSPSYSSVSFVSLCFALRIYFPKSFHLILYLTKLLCIFIMTIESALFLFICRPPFPSQADRAPLVVEHIFNVVGKVPNSLSLLTLAIIFIVMMKWIKYPDRIPVTITSFYVPACVTGPSKQCSNRVSNWSDIV